MEELIDKTNPIGKWEFNKEVTNVFDNMISRSIPDYETMRKLCYMIGRNFITNGGTISDIGCSNGLASEDFIYNFPNANFVLSDVSESMIESCKERYDGIGNVSVIYHDLRNGIPTHNNDLVISSLTLQFTPIEYRWGIIQSIYDGLRNGGALILVEKVLGENSNIDNILVEEYYNIKRNNGYSDELIMNKRKSLEGVLVPLTAKFNEYLLNRCGFSQVDCFWRCLNFCAWVAIK